jgi:exosome complex component RRP42
MSIFLSELNRRTILNLYKKNKRIDKRDIDCYREIKIETGILEKAEGSASVKIGNTFVIVGVKTKIGAPFPDMPNKGVLITNAEFTPLASPEFEPKPPGEEAIELARVVDRGIRESNSIDLESLVITKGEEVWEIWIDIYVFNDDGNLIDTSALASISALLTTYIPKFEDNEIIYEEKGRPLPLQAYPIACTFAKVGNSLVVDPNHVEEQLMTARVTVTYMDDKSICAIQKGGKGTLLFSDIDSAITRANILSTKLRKIVVGG